MIIFRFIYYEVTFQHFKIHRMCMTYPAQLPFGVITLLSRPYLHTIFTTLTHGRPQNSFSGVGKLYSGPGRRKGYFNTFHSKILIHIIYFVPKISQMSNPWTGQVPSLAYWCGRPCSDDVCNIFLSIVNCNCGIDYNKLPYSLFTSSVLLGKP